MEEEVNNLNDSTAPSGSGSSGQDIPGKQPNKIDEEIEKNLLIRTMPHRFKVSVPDKKRKKTKAVGAVIMIVGLIVMAAAVYLVYAFLINPQKVVSPQTQTKPTTQTNTNKTSTSVTEKNETSNTEPEKKEEKQPTPTVATNSPAVVETKPATTTATSTIPQIATSTTVSTTSVPAVPKGQTATIVDSDNDGLSDKEEALIGTNINLVDSDGDTFSDSSELDNLYNPAGPGRLAANMNISQYKDDQKKFSIFYPSVWRVQKTGDSVIFSSSDNSFVQVVYEQNTEKKGILLWYNEQFSDSPATLSDIIVKNGWEGLYNKDSGVFYLTDADKTGIFTISYVPSSEGDMTYYNIFRMMVSSFALEVK